MALKDCLAEAVRGGQLTQAEADALLRRIDALGGDKDALVAELAKPARTVVTREEIVQHLERNRVRLKERSTGRDADAADLSRIVDERIAEWEEGELAEAEFEAGRVDPYDIEQEADRWRAFAEKNGLRIDDEVFDEDPFKALTDAGMKWSAGGIETWKETNAWTFGEAPNGAAATYDVGNGFEEIEGSVKDYIAGLEDEAKRHIQSEVLDADRHDRRREIRRDVEVELGAIDPTKWSHYSLDPWNPTYRETVLHLPPAETLEEYAARKGLKVTPETRRIIEASRGMNEPDFRSGHFSERNIVGHMMTSLVQKDDGRAVYLIDQIQSDWGQRIRDGGTRDEAKIAELKRQLDAVNTTALLDQAAVAHGYDKLDPETRHTKRAELHSEMLKAPSQFGEMGHEYVKAHNDYVRLNAELRTAEAATPGHPLVNTTDQWVNTTLRRAIRQAVEAGAEYIAIPSGDTVLSYNPGNEHGMSEFYDRIVPKNLRNILAKLDKSSPAPQKVNTLETPTKGMRGSGFTLFPLTDAVKRSVMEEGQALFSIAGTPRGFSPDFISAGPEIAQRLVDEIQRMLPPEVAVRVVDRIMSGGNELFGRFDPARNILTVALAHGETNAREIGKHEVIHALRSLGLFTDAEWTLLVEHAKKTMSGKDITALDDNGNRVWALHYYKRLYREKFAAFGLEGKELDAAVQELVDQELVAKMAETWAMGEARYGSKIDKLLQRIRNFFEALGNAIRGAGFNTVDDIFQSIAGGEVAARAPAAEAQPEPVADPAISAEGRAVLDALAAIRSIPEAPRPFAIDGFTGSVTTSEDDSGNRVRTYRIEGDSIGSREGSAPAGAGAVIDPSSKPGVGFAVIKEQDDGAWSVAFARMRPEHRGKQIPERLFKAIEADIGQRLAPSGWLTADQYAELAESDPEAVRYHQPAGPAYDGMWVSPKQIAFAATILNEHAGQAADAGEARVILDEARQLEAMAALVPQEAKEQDIAALAIKGGIPHPMNLGNRQRSSLDAPEKGLSDLVADVNEALGLTTRHGRLNPGLKAAAGRAGMRLMGQFSRRTGVTRIAIPNDLPTLAHEGGHALETRVSTRDDVTALKDTYVEELVTPVSRNYAAPKMPASGYSGIELDADTQQVLADAVTADANMRAQATAAGASKTGLRFLLAGGKKVQAAAAAAYREAGMLRNVLIRRLGQQTADAVLDDVKKNSAGQPDYIRTRFSRTGTPRARPLLPQASETQRSEGFAEFFRLYVTNPRAAQISAPRLYHAFEDMLDGAEPDMLAALQEVQKGFTELKAASPAGLVQSRVKSAVKPGMFAQFRQDLAEKGLKATIDDKLYALYHAYVDGRHPMKRAVKFLMGVAADNIGVRLGDNERLLLKAIDDPYKLWRMAEHAKVWATSVLQNGVRLKGEADPSGPSFHDALTTAFGGTAKSQWNEEQAQLFGSYLVARRMLAEWGRHERGELENPPDSLIDKGVWRKARADIEKAHPEFAKAADQLYQFNKRHLKNKYLNGFISKDLWLELNARVDYVPLSRMMDDGAPSSLNTATGQNKRKLIYRFRGSTRDFINPLESIVQDVYATQARFALNDVIGAMDRLALAAGPGGGTIAERIPPNDVKGVTVDIREAMRQAARQLEPNDAQGLIEVIDDLFDQNASATIFQQVPTEEKGEPIVYLWEDGKRVPIRLGDNRIARDIFETMVALGRQNAEPFIDALSLGAQAFRFGVTKSPSYIAVNFLRDQLATWALSRDYVPFWSGAKGMKAILANEAALKRYQMFAGMSGIESNLIGRAADKGDMLTLRRTGFTGAPSKWHSFLRAMEVTELASRVGHFKAAYDRAIADGFEPEEAAMEAAYASHDVMDFSRKGSKMGQIARIMAFLNAATQGLDAALRTISGERDTYSSYRDLISPYIKAANGTPLSVAEKEALPNSTRIWVKMAGIGMIGVALAALYRDDDEYEEFNDYMKATHWFFKVGGVWWRVPKPFELAIVSNMFEAGFDRWWRNDERAHIRFLESLRNTVVPPAEVQGLAAIGQIAALPGGLWEKMVAKDPYKKSADSDVPHHLRALPPEMQFTAYTSELGKMIGSLLNWSPARVDAFITDTFATAGRDVLALSDQTLPAANQLVGGRIPGVSKTPRADKPIEDFWIISRFTRRESRGALSTQYFWQQMSQDGGKYTQAANGYKELLRAGNERDAKALLDRLDPERKAYAMLEAHFKENDQDIHPLNRARQVMSAMSGIRREMVLDRLVKQSTANKRHLEPEKITLSPSVQKIVNETLEDLAMREARNALVVVQHPGWKNKNLMATDKLLAELRAAAPEVADELEYRLAKGRNKVYPFEGVRRAWPKARDLLLKEGADAFLSEFRSEAKYP